ncbi:MAG: serine hydrolase [Azoarcus sp.]|jgi:D-alanyl-D-alanine endopeptidase (penicillin-binding protein 7)|nr:serine hydrolase [Azoarcus sp.]
MKFRTLLAVMFSLAVAITGADAVYAAPAKAKCAGTAKAKAKACKPAPTALASKKAPRGKAVARSGAGKVAKVARAGRTAAKLTARGKRALARQLAAARRQVALERAMSEPVSVQLDAHGQPRLGSSAFYIANQNTGEVLLQRNARLVMPIASITKLMTAMVVLESGSSLQEVLTIDEDDIDYLKGTNSRLTMGTRLTREKMLQLALMSSENRAASALARNFPGGRAAFIEQMNARARLLGMNDTHFYDSTGLTPRNVSSPRDLSRMVAAAARYPLIHEFSTAAERHVDINGVTKRFRNTNSLVKSPDWNIGVSKTGYISEAGRCLVMQAWMHGQPVVIVLMDSSGRYTRTTDAQRVRLWLDERPELLASGRGLPPG